MIAGIIWQLKDRESNVGFFIFAIGLIFLFITSGADIKF